MDDPHKLRELAGWYREFAERAGNPAIWHARLTTAEELEREADRLEKIAARGQVRSRNGTAGRAVAILTFAAGLCVAALGTAADEPARPQPTAERGVPTRPTTKPFAPPGLPEFSAGDARVVDELSSRTRRGSCYQRGDCREAAPTRRVSGCIFVGSGQFSVERTSAFASMR